MTKPKINKSLGETETETESFTLKEKISYTLFGIVVVGGSFLIGRSAIRKYRSTNEQNKTFEDGSDDTYAKQIKMAFHNDGWYGTNVDELRRILLLIASKKDFDKVVKAYSKLYNNSMMKDMSDGLDSTEYQEMLSIIAAKPDKKGSPVNMLTKYTQWAKRLKAAFDKTHGPFPGTDRSAIKAVFYEIPTQTEYANVGAAYYNLYHSNLDDDLHGELHFWEISDFTGIITSKPKS
jgi:hypothetical protein